MIDPLTAILMSSAITGVVTTLTTVAVLKKDIVYIRENLKRIDNSNNHAHERIDNLL